jgi:hypothetical protein
VSPVGVIQKLPRIPFETLVANSLFVTDPRVPSHRVHRDGFEAPATEASSSPRTLPASR